MAKTDGQVGGQQPSTISPQGLRELGLGPQGPPDRALAQEVGAHPTLSLQSAFRDTTGPAAGSAAGASMGASVTGTLATACARLAGQGTSARTVSEGPGRGGPLGRVCTWGTLSMGCSPLCPRAVWHVMRWGRRIVERVFYTLVQSLCQLGSPRGGRAPALSLLRPQTSGRQSGQCRVRP